MITAKNTTTFAACDLGDVKPVVTIGGTDAAKFVPNINSAFHGDEFFINLNRSGATVTAETAALSADKISQTIGDETDEYYIDEKTGRLKWDTIFEKCPASMDVIFNLQFSKGVEFLYQAEPSEEEKASGVDMPDEIIGSYAVYCNKVNNQYKTGKLCHIPRPFVIDAKGRREWCVLKINGNTLTIVLPEKLMLEAAYPVRLDPSIGFNSVGGTQQSFNSFQLQLGQCYSSTMPEAGTASKIYVYADTDPGIPTATMHVGYMGDNGTYPYGVIDGDIDMTITDSGPAWFSVDTSGALSSGAKYHAAFAEYNAQIIIYRDDGSSGDSYYQGGLANDTMVDGPLTSALLWRMSLYLEYTTGGGAVALSGQAVTPTNALSSLSLYLDMSSTAATISSASSVFTALKNLTATCETISSADSSSLEMFMRFLGHAETSTAASSLLSAYLDMIGLSETVTSGSGSFDGSYLALSGISEAITSAMGTMERTLSLSGLSTTSASASSTMDIYLKMSALASTITGAIGTLTVSGQVYLTGMAESITSAVGVLALAGLTVASRIYGEIAEQYIKGTIGDQEIIGLIGSQYMKGKIN
ncbi:MAG: hypothetical protein WC374_13345 [Phycisphaerae bacterium]